MTLLSVSNLSFAYPSGPPVLRDVTFDIAAGELVVLLGPNGAGKSTLLNCMMGILNPQNGDIRLRGASVKKLSQREIARDVAYVAQSVEVAFAISVREYLVLGRTPHLSLYASPSAQDYTYVDEALERLDIVDLRDRIYLELSGGQRQLVNIARALVQKPQLILFDEPTSALDYGNQIKVLKVVEEIARKENYAVVMTTHNPDHPILLDSSICLLDRDGRLIKGSVEEVMREETLKRIYGANLLIREVPDAGRVVCITPAFHCLER